MEDDKELKCVLNNILDHRRRSPIEGMNPHFYSSNGKIGIGEQLISPSSLLSHPSLFTIYELPRGELQTLREKHTRYFRIFRDCYPNDGNADKKW